MENILQDTQRTPQERGLLLNKAYWKKEQDLVLYWHYAITSEELTGKDNKEVK
jgi:hypothetical protein